MGPLKNSPHPGEIVEHEWLRPLGPIFTWAAKCLGVSRHTASELVNERGGGHASDVDCLNNNLQVMNTVLEFEVANTDQPRTKSGNSLALKIGGAFASLVIAGMIGGCLPEDPGAVATQTPNVAAIPAAEDDPNARLAELEAEVARREAEAELEARIEQLRAEAEQREQVRQAAEAERIAEQELQAAEAERELAESERAELRRQVGNRIKAAGAYVQPEPEPESETEPELIEYKVVPGDFLAAIAGAHQITLGQLFDFNPTLNADSVIHPGDVILIPTTPIEAAAAVAPVPANTPTAQPQADLCTSPSFESYAESMATHLASYATNSAFSQSSSNKSKSIPTVFFVEDWQITTILGLGLLRGDVTHIRRLQPPQVAESVHEHVLLAGDLIWDGADLIRRGIEDFSPALIESGSSLIIKAEPHLSNYGIAIRTLCG